MQLFLLPTLKWSMLGIGNGNRHRAFSFNKMRLSNGYYLLQVSGSSIKDLTISNKIFSQQHDEPSTASAYKMYSIMTFLHISKHLCQCLKPPIYISSKTKMSDLPILFSSALRRHYFLPSCCKNKMIVAYWRGWARRVGGWSRGFGNHFRENSRQFCFIQILL